MTTRLVIVLFEADMAVGIYRRPKPQPSQTLVSRTYRPITPCLDPNDQPTLRARYPMNNASNVTDSDAASVPFQEQIASTSMSLPANNAGSLHVASSKRNLSLRLGNSGSIKHCCSSSPQQRLQLVPNDAFVTLHRRDDQIVPAFHSDVVCSTQPSGTDTCNPSKPYALHSHKASLSAPRTHPSPSSTS